MLSFAADGEKTNSRNAACFRAMCPVELPCPPSCRALLPAALLKETHVRQPLLEDGCREAG